MSRRPTDEDLQGVEHRIKYEFKDKWLLRLAFWHSSVSPLMNNLRLSWIGDAVLGVVAGQLVYDAHPNSSTEVLNDERTKLVRRKACAEDVQQMGWDKLLRAVPPQLEHSENMLAELFEAVWGAVYEDCGAEDHVVRECYIRCFPERRKALQELNADDQGAHAAPCHDT